MGEVEWKRRVGRCPRHCPGSYLTPFDELLGIHAYQQSSTELIRLGCLLAVFLPFDLAAWLLYQFSDIQVSEDTLWNWVQIVGQRAMTRLGSQIEQLAQGKQPELLDSTVAEMVLAIAADGVTVPFRVKLTLRGTHQ